MARLLLTLEHDVSPEQTIAATRYLMEAQARGRTNDSAWMLVTAPKGEALVLGRYQSSRSAVQLKACDEKGVTVVRRLTGGTTAMLGSGSVHIALSFPLDKAPLSCEPRQILQKYGTLVARALAGIGLHGRYQDRDIVAVDDHPVGLVSFELDRSGVVLIEAILGVTRTIQPEKQLIGYPASSGKKFQSHGQAMSIEALKSGTDEEALMSSVTKAARDSLSVQIEDRPLTALERERIKTLIPKVQVTEKPAVRGRGHSKHWTSRPIDENIGFVEATVSVTQKRFLKAVSIHGDFMADSPGIDLLEERLKMCPIERRQVALTIDEVLGAKNHVVLGIRRLGSLLDAILDAASKAVPKMEG